MNLKSIKSLIPFLLTSVFTLISVLTPLLTPSYVNANGETVSSGVISEVVIAAFSLSIVGLLVLTKSVYWKHVFLITIFLSWGGLIQFVPFGFQLSFGFIVLDFVALTIMFFHLMFNPDLLDEVLSYLPSRKAEKSKLEEIQLNEKRVEHFQNNFNSKSEAELKRIVEQNDRVPEAVEAARRILVSTSVLLQQPKGK